MDASILRRALQAAAMGGGLLMTAAAPMGPASATDLTGLAELPICNDSLVCAPGDFSFNSTAGAGSLWDTQGGNRSYNLYVAPGDVSRISSASQFLNYGDGSNAAIDFGLSVGSYTYGLFGGNQPGYTPDSPDMFFNGVDGVPGISILAPLQTGAGEPAFAPNCSTSTPPLARVSVPGACSLSFFDGANIVTLMDYFWPRSDTAGKVIDLVGHANNTPNGQVDFVGQFAVVVTAADTARGGITGIPEPASVGILGAGLLALWRGERRLGDRRRG
jgi:hypothetical protein